MSRNLKIVITTISVVLVAILVGGLIWSYRLADRIEMANRRVIFLERASENYLNEAAVKTIIGSEFQSDGQIGKVLIAFKGEIATERDTAINAALEPVRVKLIELDTTVNSNTADGLKVALAKLSEASKRHDTVIYGSRRGLVTSLITLAERYNTTQATVGINPDHVNTILAAKNVAKSDVKDREKLTVYNQMLAAIRGQTVDQYVAEAAAARATEISRIVTIHVRGNRVEVDSVSVPFTGVEQVAKP